MSDLLMVRTGCVMIPLEQGGHIKREHLDRVREILEEHNIPRAIMTMLGEGIIERKSVGAVMETLVIQGTTGIGTKFFEVVKPGKERKESPVKALRLMAKELVEKYVEIGLIMDMYANESETRIQKQG